MSAARPPLDGVRVVDLTRVLSGPWATMLLGDLGADVVKVETPGGDPVREQGTLRDGFSWYFASFNRNKRSIALDLYSDAGREVLTRLIARADVLVENFRPGVLDKMGFPVARLEEINPRLITASVNGYGSTGPYVDRPSFDFIAQAMSGLMSVNGREGSDPLRVAPPVTDLVAGLYCALGVVAALRARELNGTGQRVEAAMVNGAISMMAYLASQFFVTGDLPVRTGNDHPMVAPYGLYRAADGTVAIAPSNDAILRKFLRIIGLEHLLEDPRYATNPARFARRDELAALIEERLREHPRAHWIERLNAGGVPCGEVQNLAQVFSDPQVVAQEMAIDVPHPGHGDVRMLGFPLKLSLTPCAVRHPAPDLGAHGEAVLSEAGFTAAEIAELAAAGVLKAPAA